MINFLQFYQVHQSLKNTNRIWNILNLEKKLWELWIVLLLQNSLILLLPKFWKYQFNLTFEIPWQVSSFYYSSNFFKWYKYCLLFLLTFSFKQKSNWEFFKVKMFLVKHHFDLPFTTKLDENVKNWTDGFDNRKRAFEKEKARENFFLSLTQSENTYTQTNSHIPKPSSFLFISLSSPVFLCNPFSFLTKTFSSGLLFGRF